MDISEYCREMHKAVAEYDYPPVTYDFKSANPQRHPTMGAVENLIRGQLLHADPCVVKDGLSNVLYWGYASQSGRQRQRVNRFRTNVTKEQIDGFTNAVAGRGYCSLRDIKKLSMPEFTKMSFTSKILMFLSPSKYPVLDQHIAKLRARPDFPILDGLTVHTSIPLTEKNMEIYGKWSSWCAGIASMVNAQAPDKGDSIRAVDVERAIFWRIYKGYEHDAQQFLLGPDAN